MLSDKQEQSSPGHDQYIAALDLGSNSFHMVIARQSHGELRIIETHGEKVQLAAGIGTDGKLSEAAQERAIACLERFHQRIRLFDDSYVQIVGTNALRMAKNRSAFIRIAQEKIGFPIEIISGREEARLIYLGVAHSMADDGGKRLVIDIGGGSTEIVIGQRFEPLLLESLHMGCISFRDRYFSENRLNKSQFKKAELEASRELLMIKKDYRAVGWDESVGSSGSIKAVANALAYSGISDGTITLAAMKALQAKMLALGNIKDLVELGIKPDRCSTFAAGFSILYAVIKVFKISEMRFNPGALREGLLYDILGRNSHENVRSRTIRSIQQRYHIDTGQCERVEMTALHAFNQVRNDWKLDSEEAENFLSWAARIYELGLAISHTQHHKHGAYLIQHSDLPGFTDRTKSILAALIRLHRRRFATTVIDQLNLDKPEAQQLLQLCVLFRLAIVMTANRISGETTFRLRAIGSKHLRLELDEEWKSKHPLTIANVEEEQYQLDKAGFRLDVV